jgi:DNA polymerase III epsilon subunit-like protein
MSFISVDIESDGPIPHKYSMVCFGAVVVEPTLKKTFYGQTRPISDLWIPEALAISGFSREEHLTFDDPEKVMADFRDWILQNSKGRPIFIADNNGFDFAWINYYFHYFLGENPFGFSSRRISDIWCGYQNDMYAKWKYFRKTKHTHDPVADAIGNGESLFEMKQRGLKIDLK